MMSSLQSLSFIVTMNLTGGAEGKDNPFSFRKFVARKEKQKDKVTNSMVAEKLTLMLDSCGMLL